MSQITLRELTPDLLPDWLAFFDHDAFADNPDWAACYCHFFHADSAVKPFDDLSGPENRAAACALIAAARLKGYLAYADGKPVGWCQAAPRVLIPNLQLDECLAVDDLDRVGAVVCFTIAEPYRRRGIAGCAARGCLRRLSRAKVWPSPKPTRAQTPPMMPTTTTGRSRSIFTLGSRCSKSARAS